jgi:hypothetical protein
MEREERNGQRLDENDDRSLVRKLTKLISATRIRKGPEALLTTSNLSNYRSVPQDPPRSPHCPRARGFSSRVSEGRGKRGIGDSWSPHTDSSFRRPEIFCNASDGPVHSGCWTGFMSRLDPMGERVEPLGRLREAFWMSSNKGFD